jgi:hypothetical protein
MWRVACVVAVCVLVSAEAWAQVGPTWTPVGRQYAEVGLGVSGWWGSGEVTREGEVAEASSTWALGGGPVFVGFGHVVSASALLELRLGLGALWFADDRLINARLPREGSGHVGVTLEAELLGRWFGEAGWTGALGINLGSVGLPEARGSLFRLSPRVGYLLWSEGYQGFWLWEVGYQVPLINGLVPDVQGAGVEAPVSSWWHVVTASVSWGF